MGETGQTKSLVLGFKKWNWWGEKALKNTIEVHGCRQKGNTENEKV